MKILSIVDTGFEELEYMGTFDLARRANIEVDLYSITGDAVEAKYGSVFAVKGSIDDIGDFDQYDCLFIPGGMHITNSLRNRDDLLAIINEFNNQGKLLAFICAAPLLLNDAGLLTSGSYTMYWPMAEECGATLTKNLVEENGNIITGCSVAATLEFGLAVCKYLLNDELYEELREEILLI